MIKLRKWSFGLCAVVVTAVFFTAAAQADAVPTTGLEIWLKADAITGVADGGAVATWMDSSGNLRDVTQANPAYQPTYQTGVLNGQPVVRFGGGDAIDDYLEREALPIDEQNLTAYAVFKINGASGAAIGYDGNPPVPGVNCWPHNVIFNNGDTVNLGNNQASLFDAYNVNPGTDFDYDQQFPLAVMSASARVLFSPFVFLETSFLPGLPISTVK